MQCLRYCARYQEDGIDRHFRKLPQVFMKAVPAGKGSEVKIEIAGLFRLHDVMNVFEGNVGAEVNNGKLPFPEQEINEEQTHFVVLTFGKEEEE